MYYKWFLIGSLLKKAKKGEANIACNFPSERQKIIRERGITASAKDVCLLVLKMAKDSIFF